MVVGQGAADLELSTGKDELLLLGRDPHPGFDVFLDAIDGIGPRDVERDGSAVETLDENLHCACAWSYVLWV